MRIEIRDAKNQLVRAYASSDPPDLTRDELAKQLIPAYWVMPPQQLGKTRGLHRWIWDLRRTRPHAPTLRLSDQRGPARDGAHARRRTRGAGHVHGEADRRWSDFTTKIDVPLDPRIKLPAAVVAQQNKLETDVADLLDRASAATLEAQSVVDQLAKLSAHSLALTAQIADAKAKLTTLLTGGKHEHGDPEVPALASAAREVADLYAKVQVDAAPTTPQLAAARAYDREVTTLLASWTAFQAKDLAQLQTALAAAKLPAIDLQKEPTTEQSGGDEE